MFTKEFYQKGTNFLHKDALLFIFSSGFEGALSTMAEQICLKYSIKKKAMHFGV